MEIRLAKPFDRKQKHSYEKTIQNWLKLRELEEAERFESQPIRSSNQETVTIIIDTGGWPQSDYAVPKEEVAGFGIFDEELGSIVENPATSTINGLTTDSDGEELGSIVENFSIDGLTTDSDGDEFASIVENPSIDGLSTDSDSEEFGSIVENPSIDGLTTDSDGEELGSIDSDLLDRRQENFCIYFRDALTAVLLTCALKGSFTRANNLLSSLKGLSAEGACIPDPTWKWTPHTCDSPSCEMNKTYIGYMIYFFMVKWALLGEN